jgi:hypothetical protein
MKSAFDSSGISQLSARLIFSEIEEAAGQFTNAAWIPLAPASYRGTTPHRNDGCRQN